MPTTGKKSGKSADFKLDNAAGSLIDLSTYFKDIQLSNDVETFDVTAFQSSAKDYLVGFTDGKISGNGFSNGTLIAHMLAVQAALSAGTLVSATFNWGPEGTTTGNPKLTGECLVTKFGPNSKAGGAANEFSFEAQITGAITATVY